MPQKLKLSLSARGKTTGIAIPSSSTQTAAVTVLAAALTGDDTTYSYPIAFPPFPQNLFNDTIESF